MTEYKKLEDDYIWKNNKKLRCGYTTGSCAAAAAKAAVRMLLSGCEVRKVQLLTPKGILLQLEIQDICIQREKVICAVRKDGGDDPDATHGTLIYASVSKITDRVVLIDGGKGVGRVTKKGLDQPIGAAAINRVPRQMIDQEIREVMEELAYEGGIQVQIFVPEGEQIAKKTFNPRLGIEGGISILGTSGIVVPMSEEALIASIRLEMNIKKASGERYLLVTPGNYGEAFLKENLSLKGREAVKCSNYVGETVDYAVEIEARGLLFIAHIGKFIKVAGGIMNTHSRCADSRAELMGAFAARAGAPIWAVKKILDTVTTDEAIGILKEAGVLEETMKLVMQKIDFYLDHRAYGNLLAGAVVFSNEFGLLGISPAAESILSFFDEEGNESEQ